MGGDWHMPHLRKYLAEEGECIYDSIIILVGAACGASGAAALCSCRRCEARLRLFLPAKAFACAALSYASNPAQCLITALLCRRQLHAVHHRFRAVLPLPHLHPHGAVLPQHWGEGDGSAYKIGAQNVGQGQPLVGCLASHAMCTIAALAQTGSAPRSVAVGTSCSLALLTLSCQARPLNLQVVGVGVPNVLGGFTRFNEMGMEHKTAPLALQAAGYRTGLIGK